MNPIRVRCVTGPGGPVTWACMWGVRAEGERVAGRKMAFVLYFELDRGEESTGLLCACLLAPAAPWL